MITRHIATFLSVVFHPLLILTYMLFFLIWVNPYEFGGGGYARNTLLIANVFLYTFMMPSFALVMMRFLGLVSDIKLSKREDRIIPYIAAGVFYTWLTVNAFYTSVYPMAYTVFIMGTTISLFMAFFVNIFWKVSIHTTGVGGLVAMVFITMTQFSYENIDFFFLASILIAGAVGTSRLILKAHLPGQVYFGYVIGVIGQVIAFLLLF
ncbi:MAG: hypothetical protein AAF502_08490 [Bacteroidota bacterium]